MKKNFIAGILFFLSGMVQSQTLFKCEDGSINFNSNAPLELINAGTDQLRGLIDVEKRTFAFVVNITSFKGFNAELQRDHFNENYMESDKYPTASFKGKIIEEADFSKEGIYMVRAKGTLNIHGAEQERIIKATVTVRNNLMTVEAKFPVLLSEHGITVPKVVHEKIASEITVEIKALLSKK